MQQRVNDMQGVKEVVEWRGQGLCAQVSQQWLSVHVTKQYNDSHENDDDNAGNLTGENIGN